MCEVLLAAFYLAAFLLFCAAVFFSQSYGFPLRGGECIVYVFGIASAGGKSGRAFFLRVAGVMVMFFSAARWECIVYVFGIASAGGKSGLAFFLRVVGVMVMFFSAARWMFSAGVQRK